MAFIDSQLIFSSFTTPVAVTTTADSSIIDITGAGVGNAPSMIGGGAHGTTAGIIGADIGNGDGQAIPYVYFVVNTAGGNNSNTLTISLKAAPATTSDTEGTYTTLFSTGAILDSALVAGYVVAFPVPPTIPSEALPRFYKLSYTASATLTPLKVSAGILLNPPLGIISQQYPSNFVAV